MASPITPSSTSGTSAAPANAYFTDDGTGTWAIAAERPPRQPTGLRWFGLDGVEHTGEPLADFDADGQDDVRLIDSDGDGLADRAITVRRRRRRPATSTPTATAGGTSSSPTPTATAPPMRRAR